MKNKIIATTIVCVIIFGYANQAFAGAQYAVRSGLRSVAAQSGRSTGSSTTQTRNFWNFGKKTQTSSETAIVPYQFKPQNFPKEGSPLQKLGLSKNASQADIIAASRKLKIAYHPDKFTNPYEKAEATKISEEINKITDQAQLEAERSPIMFKRWENLKGVGHATAGIAVLSRLPTAKNLDFQDDQYNSHMETMGIEDNQLPFVTDTDSANSENKQILDQITAETLAEIPNAHSTTIDSLTESINANRPDENNELTQELQPVATDLNENTTEPQTTQQPTTWWDSVTAGGNYLADSANNALTSTIELAIANPVATGIIATGALVATGGYLYNKYYKNQSFKPSEPIFIDEQETLNE